MSHIAELPKELEIRDLSHVDRPAHGGLDILLGDSVMEVASGRSQIRLPKPLRIPANAAGRREASDGEDSGDGWSAMIEWCRLVAALEKSRPRE